MPSRNEIALFKNDFLPLLRLFRKLALGFRDEFLDKLNLDLVKQYSSEFSKKYRTLQIRIEKDTYGYPKPAILLGDEKDFYNIFHVAESLITGIESVTLPYDNSYRTYNISEFKLRFNEFKPHLTKGIVHLNYLYKGAKRNVELKYRKEYLMIQVIDDDFMFEEEDLEFLLCMHYAFDNGYNETIDLAHYSELFIGRTESSGAGVREIR
jgi:hypothetical protein